MAIAAVMDAVILMLGMLGAVVSRNGRLGLMGGMFHGRHGGSLVVVSRGLGLPAKDKRQRCQHDCQHHHPFDLDTHPT